MTGNPIRLDGAQSLRARLKLLLFQVLERLLPVRHDLWCFCTWGTYYHTLDNPRAVFECVKDNPSIRKIVLQRNAQDHGPREGVNVEFVDAASLRGIYLLARSGVVLLGYRIAAMSGYAHLLTRKHMIIQLWHGIPLKRIGRLYPQETGWEHETALYSATVSSSPDDRNVMRQAFAPLPLERVWMSGLPRNATITKPEAALPADYRRTLDDVRARLGGRRLALYAPTWRDAGLEHYAFSDDEANALELFLRDHNAVLGVRGHSNVRFSDAYTREYATDAVLNVSDVPDANLLLRLADVLVTDYSSIYIDYLLTDRPVIHFAYDLESYCAGRGLLYEPEHAFAGPVARTFDELLTSLDEALSQPQLHADQRARSKKLFHQHEGDSAEEATRRICELAGIASHASLRTASILMTREHDDSEYVAQPHGMRGYT